jgi:Pyruvate/2-oxoacid:ferredoxin oxidoreductase delta subunit/peptidyl-tRNA hydrolase
LKIILLSDKKNQKNRRRIFNSWRELKEEIDFDSIAIKYLLHIILLQIMTEVDYYETVRQKLVLGPLKTSKHRKIRKLLKVFWNEEEAKILSHFESADKSIRLKDLAEKTGILKKELKEILARSVRIGTISKVGGSYCLLPLIPGIFEKYFQRRRDTEENQLKAAQLYRAIFKEVLPQEVYESDFKVFRPLLPLDAEEKLIEINESYDVKSQAFPYELVKDRIEKNDVFAVIPCQCRLIGEMTGESCEVAPAEMGCFIVGPAGKMMVDQGLPGAKLLNKQEAIEFLKETEKAGLVHNGINDQGFESSHFFCNCCSCHCGALYPAKLFNQKGAYPSNYEPKFNMEVCNKCETCIRKCPKEAIYHKWAVEPDSSDEEIVFREELCIGCGICAANCPNDAIKMVKVRDILPPEKQFIGNKTFTELL